MNRLENVTLDKNNPKFHTDIPRLKQGGVGAQVRVEKQYTVGEISGIGLIITDGTLFWSLQSTRALSFSRTPSRAKS